MEFIGIKKDWCKKKTRKRKKAKTGNEEYNERKKEKLKEEDRKKKQKQQKNWQENGQCEICGEKLGMIDKMFGHVRCKKHRWYFTKLSINPFKNLNNSYLIFRNVNFVDDGISFIYKVSYFFVLMMDGLSIFVWEIYEIFYLGVKLFFEGKSSTCTVLWDKRENVSQFIEILSFSNDSH